MFDVLTLFQDVRARVESPVAVILGSPRLATDLVADLPLADITCFQLDLYQAHKLRNDIADGGLTAEVAVLPDLWDLPAKFRTVLFPVPKHGERELKLDMMEQAFHILEPGGQFISLSEYPKDTFLPRMHKKIFGKCSEMPARKIGGIFWSIRKPEEQDRRRHEVTFRAKTAEHPSRSFVSRPGVFSYGCFDDGARALVECSRLDPGESVLDLGCGTGAVGILASDYVGPTGRITFADSNVRAIAMAKLNAAANGLIDFEAVATWDMSGLKEAGYDAILANPPYFAQSSIAQMFIQKSKSLLKPGGTFYIVTKMPREISPMMIDIFGDVYAQEHRGYTVMQASVASE